MRDTVQLYPRWLRLWHWTNALLFLALIVTGASLHFSGDSVWIMPFAQARLIHNVCGVLLTLAYVFFLAFNLSTGNLRHYLPEPRKLLERTLIQIRYYGVDIFHGRPQPFPATARCKFNPLQQLTYLGVMFFMLPLLIVSGLLFMFPEYAPEDIMGMGGLWPMAVLHQLLGYLLVAFLLGHLYLATAGSSVTADFRKMLRGHEIKAEEQP
ncbi:MAG: cytochrome b/b6 domain-containing protein [Magnetococcales bacterium]|nr:cytochrome b/b6 domain-containing protein [Magnetococcales bacterium]